MNTAPVLYTATVDAALCKSALALVSSDARNGTCESPFMSKVHTLASKTVLASADEQEELRVAEVNIDRAVPLNRGGGNTAVSIQRTRNEAEAGHFAVKRILRAGLDNAVAEPKARKDLRRCSPLSSARGVACTRSPGCALCSPVFSLSLSRMLARP